MTYYSGFVCAVPTARRAAYAAHAAKSWPHFARRGAIRLLEGWGEDCAHGTQTDFFRATLARADETPVFSWIEWPDRATADRAWAEIMADEAMAAEMGEMPFDGQRMFWGGFAPIVAEGTDRGGYYQGFITPVPEANRGKFAPLAIEVWATMFKPRGALGNHESWGEDVPHGQRTDFYRAVQAEPGEAVVMSWTTWPDRATCEAATAAMTADMSQNPVPEMPFDGMRMMWGGFTPVFDSAAAT